jgi:hypothetical protein
MAQKPLHVYDGVPPYDIARLEADLAETTEALRQSEANVHAATPGHHMHAAHTKHVRKLGELVARQQRFLAMARLTMSLLEIHPKPDPKSDAS